MPVSLSSWSHLRTFQPIQSGAGAMGEGKLYFLHDMSEGMSRRTWAGGDFPVAGVHTVRQVCGGLPREMPAFLQKAEEVIVGKLSDAGRAGGRRLRRIKEKEAGVCGACAESRKRSPLIGPEWGGMNLGHGRRERQIYGQ